MTGRGHISEKKTCCPSLISSFLSNNSIVCFFFLGLAFTSIASLSWFDDAAEFIESYEKNDTVSIKAYIPFTNWYRDHAEPGGDLLSGHDYKLGYAETCGVRIN